jgi:hypothetical protein
MSRPKYETREIEPVFQPGKATVRQELAVRRSADIVYTQRFERHAAPAQPKRRKRRDLTRIPTIFFILLRIAPAVLCVLAGLWLMLHGVR